MRLFSLLGIMMLASMFTLTACSDDDDDKKDNNNSLAGTWQDSYGDIKEEIIFNSNGTYEWSYLDYRNRYGDKEAGTYSVSGNKLTIVETRYYDYNFDTGRWKLGEEGYHDIKDYTFEINGNVLMLIEEDGDRHRFVKK